MGPNELASALRRIASGIENSKNPSRNLVSVDLKKVLYRLASNGVNIYMVDGTGKKCDPHTCPIPERGAEFKIEHPDFTGIVYLGLGKNKVDFTLESGEVPDDFDVTVEAENSEDFQVVYGRWKEENVSHEQGFKNVNGPKTHKKHTHKVKLPDGSSTDVEIGDKTMKMPWDK